jgi:hypothetical protein
MGINNTGEVFVEEIYGEDDRLAQYVFRLDGTLIGLYDEGNSAFGKLVLIPHDLTKPSSVPASHPLNFSGARLRGLREEDRIQDTVQSLTIPEKIALMSKLNLNFSLIGIAESRVLAEAPLEIPAVTIVCRLVRVVYALPEVRLDNEQLPYDYDTVTLYLAHWYSADHDVDLSAAIKPFEGRQMQRPMDCIIWKKWLVIAEGGNAAQTSGIHLWQIGTD